MSDSFDVQSYRGTYEVQFVADAEDTFTSIRRETDIVVCDRNVLELHSWIGQTLTDRDLVVMPEEALKSYQGLEPLIQRVIDGGITKKTRLIAIGGGITQDCTAFMASVLYRGLDWVFFPTNLLSQCDSCIGSKTSVNFGNYKNLLGGFYPPRNIYIDPGFLQTLPKDHLISGLGEMLHYYMVTAQDGVDHYCNQFEAAAAGDPAVLRKLIGMSLSIKKRMIERDEFDQGPRNVFNYGHTFGHALETATGYRVPHGIAVSYGMDLAAIISADQGMISMKLRNQLRPACALAADQFPLPEIDLEAYFAALAKDKKNTGKGFSPILTRGVGDMFKATIELDDAVKKRIRCFYTDNLIQTDLV